MRALLNIIKMQPPNKKLGIQPTCPAYFLCCYLSLPNFLYISSCIFRTAYHNYRTSGHSREPITITTVSSPSYCSSVSVLLASQNFSDLSIPLRPVSSQLLERHNYFYCFIAFISIASGVERI